MDIRIGIGYDIHTLVEGRKCILGGVEIPHNRGPLGHSDADVLSHAIADAILGAAGLADIGHFFPNDDKSIEGINSQEIIKQCVQEIEKRGFKLLNVDSSLIGEEPKIAPYLAQMKKVLSNSLSIDEQRVGIKATTNEKLGAIGRSEGIAAMATALIAKQ